MTQSKGFAALVGTVCLLLSFGLSAQTAQGKPGGGTSGPQDVNVVNTPTVNIGTGGPIGVDVLTLPNQALVVMPPKPKALAASFSVAAGDRSPISYTYTPAPNTSVLIQSIYFTETDNGGCLVNPSVIYEGGLQGIPGPQGDRFSEVNMALPPGPFTVKLNKACTPSSNWTAYLLISIYEFPTN